ncbi:MAG TPA: agenet domain-containing protein [Myxococcales bacterium]|jgi:hypothetical protein
MSEATLTIGQDSFTATAEGFRWEAAGGAVQEGPWTRVTSVTAMTATNRVEGVDLLARQHLAVSLDVGETFRAETRDAEAVHLAKQILAFASPHITARLLQELEQGKAVEFGAVTLSPDRLIVYGESWPLSEIAGHRTAHGHWMLDVGPKRAPRLAASVKLSQIPNHFALVAGLEKLLPGSEYGEDCEWLGTALRPSATNHDPRRATTRARVLALGGAGAGLLLVVGVVLAGFAISHHLEQRRADEAKAKTAARIEKAAAVGRGLTIGDAPLACASFPKDADRAVFVVEARPGTAHPFQGAPYTLGATGPQEISPLDHSTHLAFARVLSFTRLEGATFFELRAAVAVLDLESGRVHCSGQLAARVTGSQRPETRLAEGLASAVCPPSGAGPACQGATPGVKPLPPPPQEEPPAEVKPVPKPEPAKAPPKWAKGLKVEVQRKGQWLPAAILQVGKRGIRVRYEGPKRPRDETVPASRLRPR